MKLNNEGSRAHHTWPAKATVTHLMSPGLASVQAKALGVQRPKVLWIETPQGRMGVGEGQSRTDVRGGFTFKLRMIPEQGPNSQEPFPKPQQEP